MRKVGLPAGSFATWPLAQVPQVSGLFLLALPGYHAEPVAWPERERHFCYPQGVRSPEGELVLFRESAQHYCVRPVLAWLCPLTLPLVKWGWHLLIARVIVWLRREVGKCFGASCHIGMTGTRVMFGLFFFFFPATKISEYKAITDFLLSATEAFIMFSWLILTRALRG